MSWKLIKSIQDKTELRLILPFGLGLRLGDVISVSKDGKFMLEGSCRSLLGIRAGKPRTAQKKGVDLTQQFGKKTAYTFRTAGTASTLFPNLPTAKAGFDISFGTSDSWLLAIMGRVISSLDQVNRFRRSILKAYNLGVWKPDWALVVLVAKVDSMTLIASTSSDTKVALSSGATVSANASLEAKLTSDVSIAATNKEFMQYIIIEPTNTFCSALRVRDSWWHHPYVKTLADAGTDAEDMDSADDEEFWEDVDDIQ